MQYEFYIDVFFLIDFYFNLLSLFLTAACIHRTCSVVRLCFAAAAGSFWNCILILFPMIPFGAELPITITVIGGVMLMIAFCGIRTDGISHLLKAEVCLVVSAGLVNGCYSFVCQQYYLETEEGLIASGLICVLLERFLRQWMLKRERIGKDRYHVSLYYRGKEKSFRALADSGNRLCVPGSGKPVSLISYEDCVGFCEKVSGGFYIPYHAVGTENGTLFALQFEKMEIKKNGRVMTVECPVVAIVKERLSVNGDFSMILPEVYVPEA